MASPSHLTSVPDVLPDADKPEDAPPPPPNANRARTTHPLPSDRIAFQKQLEILRAFAVASADNNGSASNEHVGKLVRMAHTTVALATPFFVDTGLLVRADRGRLRPSEAVIEYSRAYQWTPDRAGHHLAPIMSRSWVGQVILPRVSVNARDQEDVLAALSSAANATTEHRQQLISVIEFAVLSGIVERNGSNLSAGRAEGQVTIERNGSTPTTEGEPSTDVGTGRPGVRTGFSQDPTDGYIEFHVDVKIRTAEFANWRPERISSFFGGIAQMLAAKGRMEEDAGGNG